MGRDRFKVALMVLAAVSGTWLIICGTLDSLVMVTWQWVRYAP